jgi:hypothetical protein
VTPFTVLSLSQVSRPHVAIHKGDDYYISHNSPHTVPRSDASKLLIASNPPTFGRFTIRTHAWGDRDRAGVVGNSTLQFKFVTVSGRGEVTSSLTPFGPSPVALNITLPMSSANYMGVVKIGVLARNGQGCEAASEVGSAVTITLTTPSLADLKSQFGVGVPTPSSPPSLSPSPAPTPSPASSSIGTIASMSATSSPSPTPSVTGTHEDVSDTVQVRVTVRTRLTCLTDHSAPSDTRHSSMAA